MATRKTTRTARKAAKKTTARKAPAKKAAAKKAATRTAKKTLKKAVAKPAKKAAKKTVVTKPATKKTAARKTAVKKAAVKKAAVKKAAVKKTAAKKTAAKQAAAKKVAPRAAAKSTRTPARKTTGRAVDASVSRAAAKPRGASRTRKPHRITPEQALANTRELLEAKQARDREPPPWRQFDPDHGHPAQEHATPARDPGQEAQARAHAEELHRGESRLKAIQGSISERDRHHQGRQDAKD